MPLRKGSDQAQPRTHIGYRDITKNPAAPLNEDMGYWIWSTSGMSATEMNRCRVSNNPPVHQFGVLQGHGLDAALGLGTADDEFQLIGGEDVHSPHSPHSLVNRSTHWSIGPFLRSTHPTTVKSPPNSLVARFKPPLTTSV